MTSSKGAVVYYLIFASQKPIVKKIIEDIFGKYRARRKMACALAQHITPSSTSASHEWFYACERGEMSRWLTAF